MSRPERPTQTSLETVRLAEEESRIARRLDGAKAGAASADLDDGALGLDDPAAPISAPLSARLRETVSSEVDIEPREPAPFSMRPGLDMTDPFGGLVPVLSEPPPTRAVRVPRVLLSRAEIAELPIDPRSAFVLCHIDGSQTLEEILDVCAMPEADALELLERLRTMGVIAI